MPKISVVIPSYNGEAFIGKAIRSVLNQTFQDFEVLVVDDCSTDGTRDEVRRLQKKDARINLIGLNKNTGGPASPRTLGCKAARGELIAFIDQDDIFYPHYLEAKFDFFRNHPNINFLASWAWTFDPDSKKIINCEYGGPVNTMIRAEILKTINYFDPRETGVDDSGMWYRYLVHYGSRASAYVELAPLTLYARYAGQGSDVESKDFKELAEKLKMIIGAYYGEGNGEVFAFVSSLKSRIGNFLCLSGDVKQGKGYFRESLRLRFTFFAFGLLLMSTFAPRHYRRTEALLRKFQRSVVWRANVFIKWLKYRKSYTEARAILSQY